MSAKFLHLETVALGTRVCLGKTVGHVIAIYPRIEMVCVGFDETGEHKSIGWPIGLDPDLRAVMTGKSGGQVLSDLSPFKYGWWFSGRQRGSFCQIHCCFQRKHAL